MSFIEQVTEQFQTQIAGLSGEARLLRESAWETFLAKGLPTRRTEHWRYTNLRLLNQLTTDLPADDHSSIAELLKRIPAAFDRLVLVDGQHRPELSTVDARWSDEVFPAQINPDKHPMAVLNLALAQGGMNITIPAGQVMDRPIALIHINTAQSAGKPQYLQHRVSLGEGAKATLIPHYLSTGSARTVANILVHVSLQANASLGYYALNQLGPEALHLEGVHVEQQAGSSFDAFIASSGARLARFDLNTVTLGPHASVRLNGVYSVKGSQHIDFHLNAEHVASHCTTQQSVRGVVDGNAKAVFNGRVCVHKGAVKSFSEQSNHNLLLSSTAEVDTKPELEIYNDDVKCAHGATVGQLDEDALFYLIARGLSKEEAILILRRAFVAQQFDLISDETLRHYFQEAS